MDNKVLAIVDADSIIWTTAYIHSLKGGDLKEPLDQWMFEMFNQVGATHYVGIVGSPGVGWRKAIVPSYKSTRPPKPDFFIKYGGEVRDHLLEHWDFLIAEDGFEADDSVASYAKSARSANLDYVICGVDKDLRQIPGKHYDYSKQTVRTVEQNEANLLLLKQTLMGDRTDNIPGLPGIGPVKAEKILNWNLYDQTFFNVIQAYNIQYGWRDGLAKFAENYLMVRLEENLPVNLERDMTEIKYPAAPAVPEQSA